MRDSVSRTSEVSKRAESNQLNAASFPDPKLCRAASLEYRIDCVDGISYRLLFFRKSSSRTDPPRLSEATIGSEFRATLATLSSTLREIGLRRR
jgi:hypothetical protein